MAMGSLAGQPLHKRGRVWSISHCGFVSICQEFLGVLTTHNVHRCTVYLVLCTYANRVALRLYGARQIVQPEQRRKTSRFTTINIELLVTHCSACPLLADSATQTHDAKLTRLFLSCKAAGPRD